MSIRMQSSIYRFTLELQHQKKRLNKSILPKMGSTTLSEMRVLPEKNLIMAFKLSTLLKFLALSEKTRLEIFNSRSHLNGMQSPHNHPVKTTENKETYN